MKEERNAERMRDECELARRAQKKEFTTDKLTRDDIAWLHTFINCTPFGEHAPQEDIARAHQIVDALSSLDTVRVPKEPLENIRRAAERGLSAAVRQQDSEAVDTFQLVLDNWKLTAAQPGEKK